MVGLWGHFSDTIDRWLSPLLNKVLTVFLSSFFQEVRVNVAVASRAARWLVSVNELFALCSCVRPCRDCSGHDLCDQPRNGDVLGDVSMDGDGDHGKAMFVTATVL